MKFFRRLWNWNPWGNPPAKAGKHLTETLENLFLEARRIRPNNHTGWWPPLDEVIRVGNPDIMTKLIRDGNDDEAAS